MIADWIRVKINGSQAYQCRQDCSGLVVLGLLVDYSVITVMYIVQVQQKRKGATPLGLATRQSERAEAGAACVAMLHER